MKVFSGFVYRVFLCCFGFALIGGAAVSTAFAQSPQKPVAKTAAAAFNMQSFAQRPLTFEANQGQMPSPVKFRARGDHYNLLLSPGQAVISLNAAAPAGSRRGVEGAGRLHGSRKDRTAEQRSAATSPAASVRMTLVRGNPEAAMTGEGESASRSNYFIGNDAGNWRTGIANFAKVRYGGVYPGVDLLYYGNQERLEFDFEVAPHADARAIRMSFEGAGSVQVSPAGELILKAGDQQLALHQPEIYQVVDGKRKTVAGRYRLLAGNEVGFEIGAHDRNRRLVIDPVLIYSTYLGGNSYDQSFGIAVDAAGNAYVTGVTSSSNFPVTTGVFQPRCGTDGFCNSLDDFFVSKFSPSGALLYSTFIGGSSDEFIDAFPGHTIAVDSSGNAYITGNTASTDYPTTPGSFSTVNSGNSGVITKLNPTGSALVYSTYLNSTDGGASWTLTNHGLTNLSVQVLAIDPVTTTNIYAGTNGGGVFKSVDGGEGELDRQQQRPIRCSFPLWRSIQGSCHDLRRQRRLYEHAGSEEHRRRGHLGK